MTPELVSETGEACISFLGERGKGRLFPAFFRNAKIALTGTVHIVEGGNDMIGTVTGWNRKQRGVSQGVPDH